MTEAVATDFDAIELDLVMTADRVPVLAHDPWVHTELCEALDGSPVTKRDLIKDLTLEVLQRDFVCGGPPDPDFPNAEVRAESVMTFDELLELLPNHADIRIHLDIKYEPTLTAAREIFAEAILDRWYAADLPNAMYASANTPEAVRALEDYARATGHDIETSIAWPRFPPGASTTGVALATEGRLLAGVEDYVAIAEDAQADGLALYYELADRHQIEVARAEGLAIQLWTLNEPELLDAYAAWPVDALITDYPGDVP